MGFTKLEHGGIKRHTNTIILMIVCHCAIGKKQLAFDKNQYVLNVTGAFMVCINLHIMFFSLFNNNNLFIYHSFNIQYNQYHSFKGGEHFRVIKIMLKICFFLQKSMIK